MCPGLFRDLHNHTKFEISGITHYNGEYVMVFDSLMELGFVDDGLDMFGKQNLLAGKPGGESEYEAITHRSRTSASLTFRLARRCAIISVQNSLLRNENVDQARCSCLGPRGLIRWPRLHEWLITYTRLTPFVWCKLYCTCLCHRGRYSEDTQGSFERTCMCQATAFEHVRRHSAGCQRGAGG